MKHLRAHEETHAAKSLFKCQFCDTDVPSQKFLAKHIRNYHKPELGVCSNWGKGCGSKATLREHQKSCKKAMKRAEKRDSGTRREGGERGMADFDPLEIRQQIWEKEGKTDMQWLKLTHLRYGGRFVDIRSYLFEIWFTLPNYTKKFKISEYENSFLADG